MVREAEALKQLAQCQADEAQCQADETECQEDVAECQEDVADKQAEIADLKEHFATRLEALEKTGAAYQSKACGPQNMIQKTPDYFSLFATGARWPQDGFCAVFNNLEMTKNSYSASVELYNENSNGGHPGIMYNAQDINNYDFVYFRPHSIGGCYQTGSVIDGELNWTNKVSSSCNGPLSSETWFTVKVVVQEDKDTVEIYFNEKLMTNTQKMNLPRHAGAGVIVANGYENTIRFRNLEVVPL
jgi:TPR repeat protein